MITLTKCYYFINMKISLLFLCLSMISDVYMTFYNGNKMSSTVTDEERSRLRTINQLSQTQTVILDGYHLQSRQALVDVHKYRNYRSVSVVLFNVAPEVQDARYTFQAEELQMNTIGSCKPQEVFIQLKYGSYPALNPDGQDFPKDFIDPEFREPLYTLQLLSDGSNITYSMTNPRPGNWFALVYNKWENPQSQGITQQDLGPECQTVLYADLQIKKSENINIIDCYSAIEIDYFKIPASMKCMSRDNYEPIEMNLTISNVPTNASKVEFKLNPHSVPFSENYVISCYYDPSLVDTQTIVFDPDPNSWHYITVKAMSSDITKTAECESYTTRQGPEVNNHTMLDLMRDEKGKFFTFDFGLPTTDIHDVTSLVNISCNEIKSLRFEVNPFIDIGGTLTLEVSLLMDIKYYMGYKRKLNSDNLLEFSDTDQFYRLVICVNIGHVSIPLSNGKCKYNDVVKPALFVLNSTDSFTIHKRVMIPYPEIGTWYMTSRLFCDEVVCPCNTSENGTLYYVDPMTTKKDINMTHSTNLRNGVNDCNATLILSAASKSCVEGKCKNHGSCMLNTVGGLLMSYCSCPDGFAGWDCSQATDSSLYLMTSVLLLTLSNMAFILSIYCAIVRLYYIEAVIYTFAMTMSTFYHACDASAQVAFCIIDGRILQFGDFFCGNMSFWVTLLAMSILNSNLRSSMHLFGAVCIALLTVWNMYSALSFLIPVTFGVTTIIVSWYLDYKKNGKMLYARSYYVRYLPFGLLFVGIGLTCFAFLQTERNYRVVHSIWHVMVALSVAFILPDVHRGFAMNPFQPSKNFIQDLLGKIFNRPQIST